jgi:hypothetical protein
MGRSSSVGIVVLSSVALAGGLAMAGDNDKDGNVNELVGQYFKKDSDRSALLTKLKSTSPSLAKPRIQTALASEGERLDGLALATELKVPGLTETAKKLIDVPELEVYVVKLLLATQEKGTAHFLAERWTKLDKASSSFDTLSEQLKQVPVTDTGFVDEIRKVVIATKTDAQHRKAGAEILKFQMELPNADPAEIAKDKEWKTARGDYGKRAQKIPLVGVDLLSFPGWKKEGTTRPIGGNIRATKGMLELTEWPEAYQEVSLLLKVRVLVLDGDFGFDFEDKEGRGAWTPTLHGTEWCMTIGGGSELRAPGRRGSWSEIVFDIDDHSTKQQRFNRNISITVDGTTLLNRGAHNGKIGAFRVYAPKGDGVVGGIEIIKK